MYKRASRTMQHALRVDAIDPSKGFVHHALDTPDIIPSAANMGVQECRAELAQLSVEMVQLNHAIALAKSAGDERHVAFLGQKHQSLQNRRSPIKERLVALKREEASQVIFDVVKDLLPADLLASVTAELRSRLKEKGW